MAGGSDGHHDVICIEAKRVCDFCFQEHRVERTFQVSTSTNGTRPAVSCEIDERNIVCREVERTVVGGKKDHVLVCVAVEVPVTITIGTEVITQRVVFLKQAVLCAPEGTDIECQVTGNCCCFFDQQTGSVSCVFNFCIVIQSKVDVRVLIKTLGTCAPKECRSVVGGCPPGSDVMNVCGPCKDRDDSSSDRSDSCSD